MAKKNRPYFRLECESCHQLNYDTNKNPKTTTERLKLRKFCKHERKQTLHLETK